ncbi:MAG: DUF4367 domain-containing protein [Mogibacterium sp.]|nr:DUF4367 domain-containing protein [Mogibacterium sp.]
MSKETAEAERILTEYGRLMFDSHARYFSSDVDVIQAKAYAPVRARSTKHIGKRALILCAAMILVMSLTVVVCSALGLQIFNYKFDIKDGFIVITNLDEENGTCYYRPEYIADHYSYSDTVNLNDSIVFYTYTNDDNGLEYTIKESISKDGIVYADNEGYDISKEIYGEYELIVFRDQTSPLIVVYMEKNGTYIAITGQLSMEEIHLIIDSLVVDDSI